MDAGNAATQVHPAAAARGTERAARVRELFSSIAPRYELINTIASGGRDASWRRRVVRELALGPGQSCLDVCCGTGDLSRALAATGASVVGLDFCRPMLERGRRDHGATPRVDVAEADALRLPIRSGSFDAACVAFGLRNLSDPERGLAELARVVRPGGRVAVLEFSRPRLAPVRWAHAFYCARIVPLIGDLLSGSWGTYRYLPETIQAWFQPAELSALMVAAGLRDVRVVPMTLGTVTLHVGVAGDPSKQRG